MNGRTVFPFISLIRTLPHRFHIQFPVLFILFPCMQNKLLILERCFSCAGHMQQCLQMIGCGGSRIIMFDRTDSEEFFTPHVDCITTHCHLPDLRNILARQHLKAEANRWNIRYCLPYTYSLMFPAHSSNSSRSPEDASERWKDSEVQQCRTSVCLHRHHNGNDGRSRLSPRAPPAPPS
jgi:hypothetical protein